MPYDGRTFPNADALDKIDRVIDLLATEERWCKQQLRTYDGRRCIQAALLELDAATLLKRPILAAIGAETGGDYLRIEIFNDHPLTTHATVLRVLHRARDSIAAGDAAPVVRVPPAARRRGFFSRLLRRAA